MSETELSVICKNCGSEVSPYVTECPYCGARLRKRAPKLERRDGALEAQRPRRRRRVIPRPSFSAHAADRPYATLTVILASAILLLVQKASGDPLSTFGGLLIPLEGEW
jgi:predicted amidophosphoribosyltransferase